MTGDIAVCRANRISLYTLNGALLLHQDVYESADDHILTCVFYEGVSDEWLERDLLFTGHRRGVVNVSTTSLMFTQYPQQSFTKRFSLVQIWSKTIQDGRFELELIRQLHHTDPGRENGANISSGISCLLALPHMVYTGDETGRVVSSFSFRLF